MKPRNKRIRPGDVDDILVRRLVAETRCSIPKRRGIETELRREIRDFRSEFNAQHNQPVLIVNLENRLQSAIAGNMAACMAAKAEWDSLPATLKDEVLIGVGSWRENPDLDTLDGLIALHGLLVSGGRIRQGKLRAGGSRDDPKTVTKLRFQRRAGRPPYTVERDFLFRLRCIWFDGLNRPPPIRVGESKGDPFVDWVRAVFNSIGLGHVDIDHLMESSNLRRRGAHNPRTRARKPKSDNE